MRKHQTQTEDFFKIRDHYSTKVSRSQMRTEEPSQTGGVCETRQLTEFGVGGLRSWNRKRTLWETPVRFKNVYSLVKVANVQVLILLIVLWLCKILTEAETKVYQNSIFAHFL